MFSKSLAPEVGCLGFAFHLLKTEKSNNDLSLIWGLENSFPSHTICLDPNAKIRLKQKLLFTASMSVSRCIFSLAQELFWFILPPSPVSFLYIQQPKSLSSHLDFKFGDNFLWIGDYILLCVFFLTVKLL